jgi:hypothetical protein
VTKEENAKRQRIWQFKRKLKSIFAYWKIMKKIGSEKGFRLIKTMLRSVGNPKKHPEATAREVLRASEWLIYLETGAKKASSPKELTPVSAEEVDTNSIIVNPEIGPDAADIELTGLLNKLKDRQNASS